jgi:hypothetical protein
MWMTKRCLNEACPAHSPPSSAPAPCSECSEVALRVSMDDGRSLCAACYSKTPSGKAVEEVFTAALRRAGFEVDPPDPACVLNIKVSIGFKDDHRN